MGVRLSDHARRQIRRRGLEEDVVLAIASSPEQTISQGGGREVRQSRIEVRGEDQPYLLRVFVETVEEESVVLSAYRTSKMGKYWRLE
jgi:hypothetical protein